jgi:uncharacterized membrane protein
VIQKIALTVAVTLSPIFELRGGIPLGISLGLNPLFTFLIAIIANALLFFPIFFALRLFYDKLLSRSQIFHHYLDSVRRKGNPKVAKYGFLGLTLLTGIPLPATGVYTATILSWLVGMNWRKAFPAIALGVVIAGIIVFLAILGVIEGLTFVVAQ